MNDPDTFLCAARRLLGERGFTTDAELITPWLTDWRGRYTGRALGLASPTTTQEIASFVKLCGEHRVSIVPQGGNSGMSGGATPDDRGESVILSLRRMTQVRRFEPAERQITCDAGLVLQTLHELAGEQSLRFPLTLGGKGSATIGGLISTNAGGTQVLRHGTMRAQILGLEAVMADGSVFSNLVSLKKDNRGFDLKQLLIGSEGTLGIVTAATLRLLPEIGERRVAWIGLPDLVTARALLRYSEEVAGEALEGFEVLPDHSLQAVLDYLPDARSPLANRHEWYALIELVGARGDTDRLDAIVEELFAGAMEKSLFEDGVIASNESQAEAFWLLRESISPAERAIGPAMQHDISVPVAQMPEFVETVGPELERRFPGTRAIGFGHLGDGNIHFHVLAPDGAERGVWEDGDGKAISAYVHDRVVEYGGSISAEHGIGQMKRDELGRLGDPVALAMMRSVKQALDPLEILNPGKLMPLAPDAATP